MSTTASSMVDADLGERYRTVRQRTIAICKPLTPEDMMVQSCPEASPSKWHLAHTSWFFESFVLRESLSGYRVFNPDFVWLFNSYYQSFAAFPEKRLRSSFSRPPLDQILEFRARVDEGVERLLELGPEPEVLQRIELGVNHEEQHQELLLTDILHAFFTNPLRPAYRAEQASEKRALCQGATSVVPQAASKSTWALAPEGSSPPIPLEVPGFSQTGEPSGPVDGTAAEAGHPAPLRFVNFAGGLQEAGYGGEGFCFDNELPRHRVWLEPYALASRLVTCAEFAGFIADGGYRRHELWLSAGWDAVKNHGWRAPLYWTEAGGGWSLFTLRGEQPLSALETVPVSHVSYFEADAYARWVGRRLATEFEWEAAAEGQPIAGNLLDSGRLRPSPSTELTQNQGPTQQFGDCWEWTASAYLGYPGFQPLPGSLGEYNGKFMSGQMVLRGGSCVTPEAHIRSSYRNFFPPETRWQFSGIRLASL